MVNNSIIIFVFLTCCTYIVGESERLTFKKSPNMSGKLNLQGYYLLTDTMAGEKLSRNVYFLYEDGKIFDMASYDEEEFDERYFTDEKLLQKLKQNRVSWGLYKISGDSISYEKWYHSGGPPKVTYIRRGSILNDTTFIITGFERSHGGGSGSLNEVYHFHKFHPKPDSTNEFIK
jgi:hypothetical protein